jgi:hypothetical protein
MLKWQKEGIDSIKTKPFPGVSDAQAQREFMAKVGNKFKNENPEGGNYIGIPPKGKDS